MARIQIQASELWELLFSEETADTYQKALTLTGTVLKETAQLIWLIICSVFVFVAWVGNTAIKAGNGLRDWVNQQSADGPPSADGKPLSETAQELLVKGRTGATYLLNQAREQLGLEAVEMPPASATAQPSVPASALSSASTPTASKPVETKPAPEAPVSAATPTPEPTAAAAVPQPKKPTQKLAEKPKNNADEMTREAVDDDWGPGDDS